ncbi:hypothetical protein ACH5RR_029301 [Cinchona calisaya]|uniref:Transposase-associated domain-containing protein n=1 Tax=Cinchona calisaya TaxID=153742 RepID=A0ABD2YR94_9GENT
MCDRLLPNRTSLAPHFLEGVNEFVQFACKEPQYANEKEIRCPCSKNQNRKLMDPDHVVEHIYKYGFMEDYWYWTSHGESKPVEFDSHGADSSNSKFLSNEHQNRYQNMVLDAVGRSNFGSEYRQEEQSRLSVEEPPNTEAAQF